MEQRSACVRIRSALMLRKQSEERSASSSLHTRVSYLDAVTPVFAFDITILTPQMLSLWSV
jgi:hypothetical protein